MSDSPAPLTLSLETAVLELTAKGWFLTGDIECWRVWAIDEGGEVTLVSRRATWPEAVSVALGYPVVARDDAAELRAALKQLLANPYPLTFTGDPLSHREGRARHEAAMRAARAALAAAEGQA